MDTSRTDAVVSVSVLSKLDLGNKNVRGTIFIVIKTQRRNSWKKKAKSVKLVKYKAEIFIKQPTYKGQKPDSGDWSNQ